MILQTIQLDTGEVKRNRTRGLFIRSFIFLFLLLVVNSIYATTLVYTIIEDGKLIITKYDTDSQAIRFVTILSSESMGILPTTRSRPILSLRKIERSRVGTVMVEKQTTGGPLIISYFKPRNEYPDVRLRVSRDGENWNVVITGLGEDTLLIGNITNGLSGIYYQQELQTGELAITRDEEIATRRISIREITVDTIEETEEERIRKANLALCARVKKKRNPGLKITTPQSPSRREEIGYTLELCRSDGRSPDRLQRLSSFANESFAPIVAERLTISLGILSGWMWYPSQYRGVKGIDAMFVCQDFEDQGYIILLSETKSAIDRSQYTDWIKKLIKGYSGERLKKKILGLIEEYKASEEGQRKQIVPFLIRIFSSPDPAIRVLRQLHCVTRHDLQQICREVLGEEDMGILIEVLNESEISVPENYTPIWDPVWEEIEGQPEELPESTDEQQINEITSDSSSELIFEEIEESTASVFGEDESIESTMRRLLIRLRGARISIGDRGSESMLNLQIPTNLFSSQFLSSLGISEL